MVAGVTQLTNGVDGVDRGMRLMEVRGDEGGEECNHRGETKDRTTRKYKATQLREAGSLR